jgi:hypothetical protein
METKPRNPQVIAGEMYPRDYYIGQQSCRRLNEMIEAFETEGIDLQVIPLINEVERGILAEDLDPGTVIGCRPPQFENDQAGVIVWDGQGLVAISFMTYHRYEAAGWDVEKSLPRNAEPIVTPVMVQEKPKKKKKKKKKTTPKHKKKKQIKARNGRRVAARF